MSYLKALEPIDRVSALDIAYALPPNFDGNSNIPQEICNLGLFDLRRVRVLIEKGELVNAFKLVESYTDTGFKGLMIIDAEKIGEMRQLSQQMNDIITKETEVLQKKAKNIEENMERIENNYKTKISETSSWSEAQKYRAQMSKECEQARKEEREIKESFQRYKEYRDIATAYDHDLDILDACLNGNNRLSNGSQESGIVR